MTRHREGKSQATTAPRWYFCLCVLLSSCTIAAARDFRAADIQTADYPTVQAIEFMNKLVQERTGGRHSIRLFHSRQLGEENETIEQTRVGAIDIDRINVTPLAAYAPKLKVFGLPFLFRSTEHLRHVLDGPIGDDILGSLQDHGFVGLTFYDSGARSFYNSVRPIRSLEDMVGLRIRVQQSEQMAEMIRALGAVPVTLAYGQVLTGLTTQLIDGAENNWPSYVTTEHYTAARYYALTEHSMAPEVLVMSKRAWDGLTPDDRTIFVGAARDSSRFMRQQWEDWEERSRQRAQAAGNIIVGDIDKKPFEAAMDGIYKKAVADPALRELIERIRQTQ